MTHQAEDARADVERHKVRVLQALLEPHELLDELEVRVGACSSVLDSPVSLVISDSFGKDHVRNANGGRARNSLHAVHVKFATVTAAIAHELDRVVEATRNVLGNMILQVVTLVDDALILMIVVTVVCRAVDHVRDANVFEYFRVLGDQIAAQIQEVIYDLRAHAFVELVLVLLPRRAPEVEVFIVQLLWRDLALHEAVGA